MVYIRSARILDVDPVRYLCRVQFVRGEEVADSVPLVHPYVANNGAGWMGALPEVGDACYCLKPTASEHYYILGFHPYPRQEKPQDEGELPAHNFEEPRNNYSNGRSPVAPGDIVMTSSAGNRVNVTRAGIVDVIADDLCWTRWLPKEHAIRSVCYAMETLGAFGQIKWYTLRDEEREENEETPVGYSAWVKQIAEAAPIVNVELGSVVSDEELRLSGRPKASNIGRSSVAMRFLVFDQDYSNRYASAGEMPDPNGAKIAVRADQAGNIEWLQVGQLTETMQGQVTHNRGREVKRVDGSSRSELLGSYSVSARGRVGISGDRGISLETGGDFAVTCGRFIVNETNRDTYVQNDYAIEAGGLIDLEGGVGMRLKSGGDVAVSAGKSRGDVVGGRYTMRVFNQADPENTGRDVAAWDLKVARGKIKMNAELGSYEVILGPALSPLARIKMFNDLRNPAQIGRIHIGFPLSKTGLTLSPDGSWQLESLSSAVKCDSTGQIQIGNKVSPAVGNVITTLSQPACPVTGVPFLGHADVVVSAGPFAPLAGRPSVGVQPPTIELPEEPAA